MHSGTDNARDADGSGSPNLTHRRSFLKGAGLAGAAGVASPFLRSTSARAASASPASTTRAGRPATGVAHASASLLVGPGNSPANLYTISYFPAVNAGYTMWSSYNGTQYQSDMQTARSLGFTSLRVFLAARSGVFDFPVPTSSELSVLADFYNRSKEAGIALHLTLFGQWIGLNQISNAYGQIAASMQWASAILGALPDMANVSCIEIRNEIPFSSAAAYPSNGFDSGWPSGTPEYGQVGQVAVVWAQQLIPYIRSLAPGVPVTASTTHDPTTDLATWVAASKGQSWAPSWYDWHCYAGSANDPATSGPAEPGLIYAALQSAISVVGGAAPLVIGETGCSSAAHGTQSSGQAQRSQADYIQAVRWSCAQLGLPDPGAWTLWDLQASAQFPDGQKFGLIAASGTGKVSSSLYQVVPPGTSVPPVGINGAMLGYQTDANSYVLPDRWVLYKGEQGMQPIASALDSSSTYLGYASVRLSGSSGSSSTDNPPALETDPVTAPVIKPGTTYTFGCYLKASGTVGTPSLEVSWYGASGGYISSANGSLLTLGTSFAQYTLRSTAPSGARYARLFVKTPGNGGSIWVTNASWG